MKTKARRTSRLLPGGVAAVCGLLIAAPPARASENISLFRLDTAFLIPHGPALGTWGVGAAIEPKFTVLDPLVVGLRLEGAAHLGGNYSGSGGASVSAFASSAYMAKAEWYLFPLSSIRPWGGLGLGMFKLAGQSVQGNAGGGSLHQEAGQYFGIAPQVGIELGSFRLAVGYNMILGTDIEVTQTIGTPPEKLSRNFLVFELGGRWGGGKKDKPDEKPAAAPASPAPAAAEPAK